MNEPQQAAHLADHLSEPVSTNVSIDRSEASLLETTTTHTAPQRLSRRLFLGRVSSLTAVVTATAAGFSLNVLPQTASSAQAAALGPLTGTARADQAQKIRVDAAEFQRAQPLGTHPNNGDEGRFGTTIRPASYTKALPHNTAGDVDPAAYEKLLIALGSGTTADFEAIPLGGTRRLVNPQAAYHYTLEGADSHALDIPIAPLFSSAEAAGEMGELYAMALARDVYFGDYATDSSIGTAVTDLNNFSVFRGPSPVTRSNIFRGTSPGCDVGPYVSQFLYLTVPEGVQETIQRNLVPLPAQLIAGSSPPLYRNEFLTDVTEWRNIQNGQNPTRTTTYDPTRRYIRNGRDLAEYVHYDYPYQAALNAANIVVNALTGLAFTNDPKFSPGAYDAGNPYLAYTKQSGFGTFGNADLQVRLAKAAQYALDHAWFQKWLVHRRLRPEEFGGQVQRSSSHISTELLYSPILTRIQNRYTTRLLPQAFPEGAPTHPAYPSGHAVYIGAQVTMLKAYLKEDFVIPNPVVASRDGLSLQAVSGVTLTIGNELNKLAWNIALARNFAGVHYRSDAREGILLGEQVAIRLMQDLKRLYTEPFSGFTLKKFDGTSVTI